jgi:hypothetical protein
MLINQQVKDTFRDWNRVKDNKPESLFSGVSTVKGEEKFTRQMAVNLMHQAASIQNQRKE